MCVWEWFNDLDGNIRSPPASALLCLEVLGWRRLLNAAPVATVHHTRPLVHRVMAVTHQDQLLSHGCTSACSLQPLRLPSWTSMLWMSCLYPRLLRRAGRLRRNAPIVLWNPNADSCPVIFLVRSEMDVCRKVCVCLTLKKGGICAVTPVAVVVE